MRTIEQCEQDCRRCYSDATKEFDRCIANAVGTGGFGKNEAICLVGCGIIGGLTGSKLAFELCAGACTALSTAALWVDIESCAKVRDTL